MSEATEKTRGDATLISAAMDKLGISSHAQLEVVAGMANNTISKARCGKQPLSAVSRAKLFHLAGEPWARDALVKLFGSKGAAWLGSSSTTKRRRK